jgi:ribonuclease HII
VVTESGISCQKVGMPPRRSACAATLSLFGDQIVATPAHLIAGVDEVGRGPLAGPVVTAAVMLDPDRVPEGLADSKQLDRDTRERLYGEILASSLVSVAMAGPSTIDRLNIRGATLDAMRRAVCSLPLRPALVLIDGRDIPPGLPCAAQAVIGGDDKVAAIAAASIVAKVTRDRLMVRLARSCPGYGFERHVGYSTPEHQGALATLGPTIHHRRSFAPVRLLLEATVTIAVVEDRSDAALELPELLQA